MTSLTNTGWLLREEGNVRTIEFKSDQIYVWVTQSAVIVYDLPKKIGFAVIYHEKSGIFEGEHRLLHVSPDVYAPDHTEWLWMTQAEKQVMIDLLRTVVSFRTRAFPAKYAGIWKNGVDQVKSLIIQNPGSKKYNAKWIPGLG